jgi:hypothetical protein
MLVGDEVAATYTEDIHRASDPELSVLELEPLDGVALILCDLDVKAPTRIYGGIGEPQAFHLLQVEQAFAIRERMK